MRRKIVLSVFMAVAFAVPAHAQWRQTRQLMNSNMAGVRGILGDMGNGICQNHRGTGDSTELAWCYGIETDGFGNVTGRNQFAAYPGQRYQRYPYQFRQGQSNLPSWLGLGATVLGDALILNKLNHQERERTYHPTNHRREYNDRPRTAQEQERPRGPIIVTNRTGDALQVNGQRLENHDATQINDPDSFGAATRKGSSCAVKTEWTGQDTADLICAH